MSASGENGRLLELSQARSGFAGIDDFDARVGGGLDEFMGQCGHAGKALQKIQGDPLGREDASSFAFDLHDDVAWREFFPVLSH